MNRPLTTAGAVLALSLGWIAAGAQNVEVPVVDSAQAFAKIGADATGTVSQPIMHAPAGDVIATYFGRAPRQVFSKQDELIYVISGSGTVFVGYPSYAVKPGSVISIPRNTAFEITASGNVPIKAIVVASPSDNPADKQIL